MNICMGWPSIFILITTPNLHLYNRQAACSQSPQGSQPGQLQFLVVLLSWKDQHRCRCFVKGVLTRVHVWQLWQWSQGHSCSSARGCHQRPHKSHLGLQLQSEHSGCSPGQSAGHLMTLEDWHQAQQADPTLSLVISRLWDGTSGETTV